MLPLSIKVNSNVKTVFLIKVTKSDFFFFLWRNKNAVDDIALIVSAVVESNPSICLNHSAGIDDDDDDDDDICQTLC